MIITLRFWLTSLLASYSIVDATGTYYEETSETHGATIIEDSMQLTPIIHKSFHHCSTKEYCNYVTKDIINGNVTLVNSENDLPLNSTGLRNWKKIYHGPLIDCRDAYNRGNKKDGSFRIKVPSVALSKVRCDMTTVPRGWTVFQRRVDGTVNFYRNWQDYKTGFGNLNGKFWLGLETLHQFAAPGKNAALRVDLKHMNLPGQTRYAEYSFFEISDESDGYRLKIGGYSGNAGDSLAYHSNMKFSTKDRDLDTSSINCSAHNQGAFWYRNCYASNLNGIYPPSSYINNRQISWYSMPTKFGRITFCEMKIRL